MEPDHIRRINAGRSPLQTGQIFLIKLNTFDQNGFHVKSLLIINDAVSTNVLWHSHTSYTRNLLLPSVPRSQYHNPDKRLPSEDA